MPRVAAAPLATGRAWEEVEHGASFDLRIVDAEQRELTDEEWAFAVRWFGRPPAV
ncbi:MAG: hypothetical protein M5U28_23220 [Sandaracinaceae bacterium]|nr:hypothetical protein [Sandaracinaceae bacterium]